MAPLAPDTEVEQQVEMSVELSCHQIGFSPPPYDCHLRLLDLEDSWVGYAWSHGAAIDAFHRWLARNLDLERTRLQETSRRVLIAHFETPPRSFQHLLDRADMRLALLRADGSAALSVAGARSDVRELLDALENSSSNVEVTDVRMPSESRPDTLLTTEQHRAIGTAFEEGYFDVPRRVRLADLAERLGTSTSALSETLRRGLYRLVEAHLTVPVEGAHENLQAAKAQADVHA
ncbi:hypothetical protein BRD56_06095 [Thermoplasmatales archaeon SW_10_69_26]|nr:MAG: hypothetical protein BRD56_06095 [Thermoplasmatales archaeon SW_10_69_26]